MIGQADMGAQKVELSFVQGSRSQGRWQPILVRDTESQNRPYQAEQEALKYSNLEVPPHVDIKWNYIFQGFVVALVVVAFTG